MPPVNVARLGAESIIDTHSGRIVHARRPLGQSALRPCLEVVEQPQRVELTILLCLRTEACPDAYHEMGMLTVYLVNHLLSVKEVLVDELHGIPRVVGTPVLPVLNDAVERYLALAVAVYNVEQLLGRLVAFLRLPVAVGPQREHRYLSRQRAHLGDVAIDGAAQHEVIVNTIANL